MYLIPLFLMFWMISFYTGMEMLFLLFMMMIFYFVQYAKGSESQILFSLMGDLMSINLFLLSIWIGLLMMLASSKENLLNNKSFMFYLYLILFLLFMCFFSTNLLMFFFFFESILFPIVMMIFNWGNQPERLQAGVYMLLYTLTGSMPLLVMMMMYSEFSFNYFLLDWMKTKNTGMLFFLMVFGFLVKVPMFFTHLWLPKAHVEAPIAGSMILAAVLLKLGIYGLYRFKCYYMLEVMELGYILAVVSIFGGMYVGMMCVFQTDIKSLIAYSSVCHMGLVLGSFMNLNYWGTYGGLLMMLGHGLCSSGLFCLGNILYERFFTRSVMLLKGMMKIFPNLSLWWFLMSIINMSAPPSMNLMGELFLMGSLMKFSIIFMFPLMMISFLSACYSLYLFSYVNHGEGWVLWSVKNIFVREYVIIFFHFFPLLLWIFKMDLFTIWI
uniref:NADH-ubiquinone oxidoreductase chain 4 n=1 Tax=Ixodes columnae TaxID=1338503 RepID=A0A977XWI8_9ACAR|nr:NADH dehydrogenase subunit 4 [Ixodes columnae]UXX50310.1 NADH dehydrogenase subunit 4 [Ixodes columnae]